MNNRNSEENRLARAKRNQEKRDKELEEKRQRKKRRAARDRQTAQIELSAINNEKTESEKTKSSRKTYNKKAKTTNAHRVGPSKENRKWQKKRLDRYNQRVWKGWRENDGESQPVQTYHIDDLEK
ncbi:hypothetical protein [Bacillus atrophaeus]|uniref:hypothetical protein n=1 Tax=Bacillus atrophaeus TaxID=1452 RepID=UPI002280D570|nr:hypothetical protein [Bacillus atrophaeus]MCY8478038.1 hypothetical protein [Bacillus atrophaeus]